MARLLGEAYIAILPQTDQFGSQLRAQVDKDAAAVRPEVNVGAQLNKADIAKVGTQLKAISKANPINVGVNLDKSSAARMVAQLAAYTKAHTVDVVTRLDSASLGKMQTQLQTFLSGKDMEVGLQLNPAQLAKAQGTFDAFVKEMNDNKVSPNWNILPALSKMQMLKTANASLGQFIQEQNARNDINLNIMPALAKIVALKAAESTLDEKKTGTIDLASGAGLATATAGVNSFMRALMGLSTQEANNDTVTQRMGRSYGVWGAAISALQVHIPLFGGALSALHFPNVIAQASGWHILAEAVIETAAVWGPAAIAMGIFAAASYQDAKQIVGQWKTVQTVMSATNTPMDGLTTGLSKLSQALKPEIWDAFGAGLTAIETSSGKLTPVLQGIGHLFDVLGAHIDQLVQGGGGGFAKFIQGGANDLHELGEAFGNVGKILAIFFESVPGYATILLHLGTDILGATADVLQFIQPLLKIGLAVHGAIFYLGLASTLFLTFGRNALAAGATVAETGAKVEGSGSKIANLGTGLGNLVGGFISSGKSAVNWGRDLLTAGSQIGDVTGKSKLAGVGIKLLGDAGAVLADVPVAGWAIAAAAAIGVGLYFALRSTTDAIQKMGQALVQQIQDANPNTLFTVTTNAVIKTGQAIESLTNSYNKLAKAQTSALSVGPYNAKSPAQGYAGAPAGKQAGPNSQPVYQPAPASQVSEWVNNLQAIAKAAIPAANNETAVAKAAGGMGNAISVATALGIKWNSVNTATPKQLANIVQEINNYTKAIDFMSNSQGQAASNLAAMTFAASAQISNVHALNSAWQTYIGTVEGGEAAFVPFEQGIQQFAKDAKVAGASMTGLNAQSLTLRGDFQSVFSGAQAQISALTTYTAATGGATAAQKALANQGIKAVIAQLVPMAGANASARAGVVALAQRANGSLTTWQAVVKWLGPKGAAGAAQTLQRVNGTLATSIQNVTSVANALSGAMQATAIAAQDKLVYALVGAAGKMTAFGKALATSNGALTKATVMTGTQYYNALVKSGVGAETARQMTLSMAKALGMSSANLNVLNADLIANQNKLNAQAAASTRAGAAAKAAAAAFMNFATGALKMTSQQVTVLWNNIRQQDLDMVSGKANNAKQSFMNFATNGLHLTTAKAEELWNELHQQGLDTLANKASTTKSHFVDLAMNGLHLTSAQANALWGELRLQYLDTIAAKGLAAKNSFINLAKQGLDLTTSQANTLWNTLRNQYLDTLAGKAGETEAAFVKVARQFGLSTSAADALWTKLRGLAGGSPYSLAVLETLSGQGSISATVSAAGVKIGSGATTALGAIGKALKAKSASGAAKGAWVGGNHSNVDSVHAVLKPGELVVPSEMAPTVAGHMAAGGYDVPHMAAGGTVGAFQSNAANAGNTAAAGVPFIENAALQFTQEAMSAFAGDLTAAQTAAEGGPSGGPLGPAGAGEMANGASIFKYLESYAKMTPIAAAGAIASIWGESTWNPMAQGTGGRGLIGWTPAGTISNAAFQGGLSTQLPMIIKFISTSGDWGVISEMNRATSVLEAANEWGKGVERYGINDVHPEGLALATSIMNSNGKSAPAQGEANAIAKVSQLKPHSAGGMISEPVYGFGKNSGVPYSFAENGPEYVSPGMDTSAAGMPGAMTSSQAQTMISLLQTLANQGQQQPYNLAKAINGGASAGMRSKR